MTIKSNNFIFFFQAEDGIRDGHVTGVQTCALPISAADLYSLGKVLYEMSTGLGCGLFPELPSTLFQRSDHIEMLSLNAVILQACRQNPSERYQSAAEMREALLQCRVQRKDRV